MAPSGLGGGGGDRHELIITWTVSRHSVSPHRVNAIPFQCKDLAVSPWCQPMAREYQNGDGFGYVLAFKRSEASSWTTLRIPRVESSRYVFYNASLSPYSPFDVKIKAYNRRGEGPFSQTAVVHSAEEGEWCLPSPAGGSLIPHPVSGEGELASSHTEPTVGPLSINATALSAFEIQVSWEPVQHLSADGLLRGYEVGAAREM